MAKKAAQKSSAKTNTKLDLKLLDQIAQRALYLANRMIFMANHRDNVEKGDPKIGGHSSASTSALHILGTLHLLVKSGFDHIANKPHASPADHSYNYLLDLFLNADDSRFSLEEANQAMAGLRAYSQNGEPVFQSYHSAYDCDHHNFFPSGTVGIPPVKAGYLALAYRYAARHGYEVPDAHFWSLIGDSEFREGSLFEAVPDFAERQLGNLTWIVDYNRQSLDGHRITNQRMMNGTDADRIERTMHANGWEVIQVRHGRKRQALFAQKGGDLFQQFLENELADYDLQVLLQLKDPKQVRKKISGDNKKLESFLKSVSDQDLIEALQDMGGHDFECLYEAMMQSKESSDQPTLIIAHTIKGWGLQMAATPGNHSSLPDKEEIDALQKAQGLPEGQPFGRFEADSKAGQFLKKRGDELLSQIKQQHALKEKNKNKFLKQLNDGGEIPPSLSINLKMASYPHTQWMLGQLTAKLTRIANTPDEVSKNDKHKPLTAEEKPFKLAGEMLVSMAPDVGTSTNLNPAMDGKIYSANEVTDVETEFGVKDRKLPDLVPGEERNDRFLRFEIVEGNVMSCMGSFGRMRDLLGIPLLPLMTVYDFFVKRALDQYFYNQYWKSSFILVGTPSGVTLSPEGAQHGWKSDFQIPNQITWEPFFCQELDWILVDAIKRHLTYDNEGRCGVNIRGVTRGAEQKDLLKWLKKQRRFKTGIDESRLLCASGFPLEGAVDESQIESVPDEEIMAQVQREVLQGAYHLIDYRGYANYEPGDNVIHIFSMGSLGTEAIKASQELLSRGIYANVIVVTSPDLLVGNLAHENGYAYLKQHLGISSEMNLVPTMNGALHAPEVMTLAGRRTPIVSVHDGEPGLLDNIGSVVGVRHEALAVRKHSKCGRPSDIYHFHKIDAESIVEACGQVLAETALESVRISNEILHDEMSPKVTNWRELWPTQDSERQH